MTHPFFVQPLTTRLVRLNRFKVHTCAPAEMNDLDQCAFTFPAPSSRSHCVGPGRVEGEGSAVAHGEKMMA